MVDDLELDAELAVLVLQGVEAVRAGRDDLLDLVLLERLDVLLGQALEDELVAGAAGRVAGAGLAVAEHAEGDAGHVEQLGDRPGGLLGAVLVGAGAADPEQPVDRVEGLEVLADDLDLEVQALGPVHPRVGRHVPRVALVLQALEQPVELGREVRLDQHLVAAHVDDVVDVLDVDRALLDAGAAGDAGPQHVGVDDARRRSGCDGSPSVAPTSGALGLGLDVGRQGLALGLVGQEVRRLGERVVAQPHDQQLGRQRLLGVPGRALRLAAAALGAGGEVEQALPGEVLDRADAERGVLVEVVDVVEGDRLAVGGQRLDRAERDRLALEEHVERRHEDVQVLGVHDLDQEHQHHADVQQQADALEDLERAVARGRRAACRRRWRRTRRSSYGSCPAPRRRRGTGTSSR